jgi:hypothetical protein
VISKPYTTPPHPYRFTIYEPNLFDPQAISYESLTNVPQIDFHRVAADFSINPAAARMRWTRLRKNLGDDPAQLLTPFPTPSTGNYPGCSYSSSVSTEPTQPPSTGTLRTPLGATIYAPSDNGRKRQDSEGQSDEEPNKKTKLETPEMLAHKKKLADAVAKFSLLTRHSPFPTGGGVPVWPRQQQGVEQWAVLRGQSFPVWPQQEEQVEIQWSLPPLPPPAKLKEQQQQNISGGERGEVGEGEEVETEGLEQQQSDSDVDAECEDDIEHTELQDIQREKSPSPAVSSALSSLGPTPEPEPEEKKEKVKETRRNKNLRKGVRKGKAKAEITKDISKNKVNIRGEGKKKKEKKAMTTTRSGRRVRKRDYRQLASEDGATGRVEVPKDSDGRTTRSSRKRGSRTEDKDGIEERDENDSLNDINSFRSSQPEAKLQKGFI